MAGGHSEFGSSLASERKYFDVIVRPNLLGGTHLQGSNSTMIRSSFLRKSLDLLFYSGLSHALAGSCQGIGAIFMLHHVQPGADRIDGFAPNAELEVSPEFLDEVIRFARKCGYDLVSLDEAVTRIEQGSPSDRPFAAFTLDDGYRDNFEHAWPVFKANDCPFTIFVSPAITDGVCELWWRGLEAVIAGTPHVSADLDGEVFEFDTVSDAQKSYAFAKIYWPLRNMPEHRQRAWTRAFCWNHGVSVDALCLSTAMTWDDVREIAQDPLCTIGAHTINHFALARLDEQEAYAEITSSRDRIEIELGIRPDLFAYPYGDPGSAGPREFDLVKRAGFRAAVTTRKGKVFAEHRDHLTALPRVSLNGGYQKLRYVEVLLSGAPFALMNRFRRVNAA